MERIDAAMAAAPQTSQDRAATAVFSLAIFTAAALLFMVQPLAARMILPVLGGSPAVWIAAVAFFQTTLLLGYAYAHLTARLGRRPRAAAHAAVMLIALLFLPLALPAWVAPSSEPHLWLVGVLALAVGAPFFVLSSASPALAYWYTDGGKRDPYFLYAVSNAGSFVGLMSYPLVIEPILGLGSQATMWAWGFAAFALLAAAAVAVAMRSAVSTTAAAPEITGPTTRITWSTRLAWVGLAFVPSSLLLGSTTFITSEIGSVPLLWVLPLAAYLLTFVVAFRDRSKPIGSWPSRATALLVFGVLTTWAVGENLGLWLNLGLHVSLLFTAGLVAHLRLYNARPAPTKLTEFYLLISFGGALGGVFNAFIAPLIFDWAIEYPIVIVAATALLADRSTGSLRSPRTWAPAIVAALIALIVDIATGGQSDDAAAAFAVVAIGIGAILLVPAKRALVLALGVALLALTFPPISGGAVFRERTFFGILSVRETATERSMFHGTTLHGTQFLDERRRQPAAYYTEEGPLGDVFASTPSEFNVGVIGLGVGTMAAYGKPGDTITFFEIDSAVVELAQDPSLFTFLSDSAATINIEIEDGRLGLEKAPLGAFDLIVLDAFSADAIPVHLLTVEALAGYLDRLAPDGMIAIHGSNRYFDLEPVIAAAADALGVSIMVRDDAGAEGRFASRWFALSPEANGLEELDALPDWRRPVLRPGFRTWTDDYSNPLAVVS